MIGKVKTKEKLILVRFFLIVTIFICIDLIMSTIIV